MIHLAAKPIFKPETKKRKKRLSGQELYLKKNIYKIRVKNPATDRTNTLWNFRILSPKALRKMEPDSRNAFEKLHLKYKKEEAKLLKKWRQTHKMKGKDVGKASKLPTHLVTRHNLLIKQHGDATLDLGEGPMKAKDLIKRAKDDPDEYERIVRALDKVHKKERSNAIKRHGDGPVTMPDGSIKTVKEALQQATKTGDRKLFKEAMKSANAFEKFSKKEALLTPKQVTKTAKRFMGAIANTIKSVDAKFKEVKEQVPEEKEKEFTDVFATWEDRRKEFAATLGEAKTAIEEFNKKRVEVEKKIKDMDPQEAKKSRRKEIEQKIKDIDETDADDASKDQLKQDLWDDFETKEKEIAEKAEAEGKPKKPGILSKLFKALAGSKKFFSGMSGFLQGIKS